MYRRGAAAAVPLRYGRSGRDEACLVPMCVVYAKLNLKISLISEIGY